MKKIVITGANGFIGHHLVNYLSNLNYEIYALLRENTLPRFKIKKNVHIIYGDIRNKDVLRKLIPYNSIIINLAANPYHPTLSYQVNIEGIKTILEIAGQKKVKKLVQMSSQSTKLPQKGVYGKTKQAADNL